MSILGIGIFLRTSISHHYDCSDSVLTASKVTERWEFLELESLVGRFAVASEMLARLLVMIEMYSMASGRLKLNGLDARIGISGIDPGFSMIRYSADPGA